MIFTGRNVLAALASAILVVALARPAGALEFELQQEVTGTVRDTTGGVLPGVLISVPALNLAVDTDNVGYYVMKDVPPGKHTLQASLPGFETKEIEITVEAGQNLKLDIVLEVQVRSEIVTVEYTAPKLMTASASIGTVSIQPNQVATLPSLGEKDIFRSIQLLPGISASTESSSGLYVRGGTPDQNLVLFDGFTVYKVDHFFGIFSAFNANAVESTTIQKGGFDARYGGRLSSVVDLVGKTKSRDEIEVGGGISLLSYNGYLDGPLGKNGSFLIAGRRSFQSPFSKRIRDRYSGTANLGRGGGPMGMFTTEPLSSFYDLNAKAAYAPGSKDTLTFSMYYGRDNFDNSRTIQMPSFGANQDRNLVGDVTDLSNWGNTGASLSWQRNWNHSFISRVTVAYSRYFKDANRTSTMMVIDPDTGEDQTFETGSVETNRLNDGTLRWANNLILGRQHYLEFGAEAVKNKIDYYYNFNQDMGQLHRSNKGYIQAFYVQDRVQPFGQLEVTPGVRATRYTVTKGIYLEPRLSLILHATDRLRFKAAGGLYHQFTSDLTREDPMGGDQNIWTLTDGDTVPVSRASHYIGGVSYESTDYLFDVEAYRKDLKGLTEFGMFRPGGGRPPRPGDEPPDPGTLDFSRLFFGGSARAEGVEFLVQKKFGADTGWVTYTLGRVRNDFPGLSPAPYPASHDSTHEVKVVNSYQFRRFTISGNWIFATGKPITEPTGSEEITMPDGRIFYRPTFGDKNAARLPDYHRLDLSVTWDFYRGEVNKGQAGVSIFNVYNRANVWRRQYNNVGGDMIMTDVNYLGLTVSAFLNFNLSMPSTTRKAGPAWHTSDSQDADNSDRFFKPGREYNFYGYVVSMSPERVTLRTDMGTKEFLVGRKALLGEPEYEEGAYVHVYYREQTEGNVITMMVRKVKDAKDLIKKK